VLANVSVRFHVSDKVFLTFLPRITSAMLLLYMCPGMRTHAKVSKRFHVSDIVFLTFYHSD
jgi:hypothetical protein